MSQLRDLAGAVNEFILERGQTETHVIPGLPGFMVLRKTAPTRFESTVYQPVICLILQGAKEIGVSGDPIELRPGAAIVFSHDLSITGRTLSASPDEPFLAMVLALDMAVVRSLYDQIDLREPAARPVVPLDPHPASPALIDAMARYFALHAEPVEAAVLEPLIQREIHFRLLTSPQGAMLRRMLRRDSHASRIAQAISAIREDFRSPLAIADLAAVAAMSSSSFHQHFKAITGTTPLQYQKDLRLMEAQRLLSSGERSVSAVAFAVGYESPTQFSREYARKFGLSPRRDIGRQLATAQAPV